MARAATAMVAAAGLAVLAGCTAPQTDPEPAPTPEPTSVTVGVVGQLTSFNPGSVQGDTAANRAVSDFLSEGFAYLDDTLQVVGNGGFGEVERISADPLQVQYRLFDPRRWSDGTPVSVDDLMFAWAVHSGWFDDAAYDENGTVVSGTRYFDVAASTDGFRDTQRPVVNRGQRMLTLTYDEPFADWNREWLIDRPVREVAERAGVSVSELMSALRTMPKGDPLEPVEPNPVLLAAAQAWNTGFDVDPTAPDLSVGVSDGPYQPESFSGDSLQLSLNENYEGNHQPTYDHVVLKFFPDAEAQLDAVIAGEVDVANLGNLTAAQARRLDAAGIGVLTGARPQTLSLIFNDDSEQMDATVREALGLSIDRDQIVDESVRAVHPDAAPLRSFISSPAAGSVYDEIVRASGLPANGADVNAAIELLDGAEPVVRIHYEPTDVLAADLFGEIARMATRAGITVRPVGQGETADAEIVASDVSGTLYDVARERVVGGAGGLDALDALTEMRANTDPEEVALLAARIDAALAADGYGIPLVSRAGAVSASADVQGVGYTGAITGTPRYFWTWAPTG